MSCSVTGELLFRRRHGGDDLRAPRTVDLDADGPPRHPGLPGRRNDRFLNAVGAPGSERWLSVHKPCRQSTSHPTLWASCEARSGVAATAGQLSRPPIFRGHAEMAPKWPQRRLQIATDEKHADLEGADLQVLLAPRRRGPTASHARGRRFETSRAHEKCLQMSGFAHRRMHRSARRQCARLCARTLRAQTPSAVIASNGGLFACLRALARRARDPQMSEVESLAGRARPLLRNSSDPLATIDSF